MKILVTACQVPFEQGGAEQMIQGLMQALSRAGHQTELVRFPFKFMPCDYIEQQMDYLNQQDFSQFSHHHPEKVISLQFPGYGISHPDHTIWLIHQHRAVYELYPADNAPDELARLRHHIHTYDNETLRRANRVLTISQRVSQRLQDFNGIASTPLYHPPPHAEQFYTAEDYGYIFYPSRIEPLKRQRLLIEAAQHLKTPVRILIAGTGSDEHHCRNLIDQYQVSDKVTLMGRFTDAEKPTLYARSLGVFFGPYDEDYGYITLEAQLSGKPVITCTDSGGPLEFVTHEQNGFICPPDPEILAQRFDWLYQNRSDAAHLGATGKHQYLSRRISWKQVIDTLITP